MAFSLIFTIGLSIVLLLGALFISKSGLPPNDKIVSIIAILALFSLVSIVNEVKKPPIQEVPYNVASFQKSFSTLPDLTSDSDSKTPVIEAAKEFAIKSLGGWDPELTETLQFAFVQSDHKVGKTLGFKEYTRVLHSHKKPALYIDIPKSETDVDQFVTQLGIPSLNVLDELIGKLNAEGKVPSIFIDNIQNAFLNNNKETAEFSCSLCEYFRSLFDNKQVNVIFISGHSTARDYLRSTESFNRRLSFYDVYDRNLNDIDNYVLERANSNIGKEDKKFTLETIKAFFKAFGWDFQALNEYIDNIETYDGLKGFIDKYIQLQSQKIGSQSEYGDLMRALLSLTREKNENFWMPYGVIKKRFEGNPLPKLEEAVKENILSKKDNSYRFKNQAIYNAALTSQGYKIVE